MDIAGLLTGVLSSLVASGISAGVDLKSVDFFKKRKIQRSVDAAVDEVASSLVKFLENEKIGIEESRVVVDACQKSLNSIIDKPDVLFSGSLDPQKIFNEMYDGRNFPVGISEAGLESVYEMFFLQVCTVVVRVPFVVAEWGANAWRENFSRLDEISKDIIRLFSKIEEIERKVSETGDVVFDNAKRLLRLNVEMKVDLTGLRADQPLHCALADMFVHPCLVEKCESENREVIQSEKDALRFCINNRSLAVVFGDPGSGKSTWSRWLQSAALALDWHGIVVRCELRKLILDQLPSFCDLVKYNLSGHVKDDVDSRLVDKWASERKILFVLDGFDEIAPGERDRVLRWIMELNEVMYECSIIVTSRPLTSGHFDVVPEGGRCWQIMPFDEQRIASYVSRWYKYSTLLSGSDGSISEHEITDLFFQDPTIKPLASNPLLLSTLLLVHHLDGKLPNGRSELYRRYIDGMLGLWDARRKVNADSVDLTNSQKRKLLSSLASYALLSEKEQFDEETVLSLFRWALERFQINCGAVEALQTLFERSGLLVGPGTISFVHKSVSEYFVAELVVQGSFSDWKGARFDRMLLFQKRKDDRWNVVLFLWAGLSPVKDLCDFFYQCIDSKDWRLAAGLFLDQIDRIDPVAQSEIIQCFVNSKIDLSSDKLYYVMYPEPAKLLWMPDLEIRSISGRVFFNNLLSLAFYKRILSLEDIKSKRGVMRELLWCNAMLNTSDEMRKWVSMLPKSLERKSASWLEYPFYRISIADFITVEERLSLLNTFLYPSRKGLLALYTLTLVLEKGNSFDFEKNVVHLFFEKLSDHEVLFTKNWYILIRDSGYHKVDLIRYSLKAFNVKKKENDICPRVSELREKLILLKRRRDALSRPSIL